MKKTFFFYDLETSGLNQRYDRIMQFAGQRTDMDLNLIDEPVDILVKITPDALPSPQAIGVTKITPQKTLAEGLSEAEFCQTVVNEIFTPGTIAVGYNTVRFDDEFMRATLWRNFHDPYEWEWKDGRSRWDMLDVVRLTRALRPEGINWPVTDKGKSTNRLELITKLNGLKHEHAHDALSDVYATIAVAKLIRDKQPQIFNFLLEKRGKRDVQAMINLDNKQPFVYASGRYSGEFEKTTVAVPLTAGRHGNILVYDLRYNLEELLAADGSCQALSSPISQAQWGSPSAPVARPKNAKVPSPAETNKPSSFFPIVKELCYNKCPAVAPLGVLEKDNGWEKIGLTPERVRENLKVLLKHPEFAEQMRTKWEEQAEFPPSEEPEVAIYDGFLNDSDRVKVAAVRNADESKLADFHPDFHDARLPELLLHYKGRNYPDTLDEKEVKKWEEYRRARIEKQIPKFMEELEKLHEQDEFVAEELKLYLQSLL